MKHRVPTFVALSLSLLAACGDGATGDDYRGSPLYTVTGQMTLSSAAAPSAPLRLAVAWYPNTRQNSAPSAIITQEVQFEGSFPLDYSFSFYDAPPASALNYYNGTGSAWGVLLAYIDLNGNGQLDTIANGASPVDHVVGASSGDYYNGGASAAAASAAYVVYIEGAVPEGYAAGYNTWRDGRVLAAGAPLPISLDGTNELDIYVCEAVQTSGWDGVGLPCNITPTGGLHVGASLGTSDGYPYASVWVSDGASPLGDALVEVNGTSLTFSAADGWFGGEGAGLLVDGRNEIKVTPAGGEPRSFFVDSASEFTITSPAPQRRLLGGDALTLRWTQPADAVWYSLQIYAATPPFGALFSTSFDAGTGAYSLLVPEVDDYQQLSLTAYGRDSMVRGLGASWAQFNRTHTTLIDVVSQGMGASGSLVHYTYAGETTDAAWIWAYDGLTELDDADVSVAGEALGFDATQQAFVAESAAFLSLGAANELKVQQGDAVYAVDVGVPGALSITPPPASVAAGEDIGVSWSASSGAVAYEVWLTDVLGNLVLDEQTLELAVSLGSVAEPGSYYLNVAAYAASSDRHVTGYVQTTFDLEVTP